MKVINDLGYPDSYILAVQSKLRRPEPEIFRVTEFVGPPMIRHLMLKYWDSLETLASEHQASTIGTAFHKYMEDFKPADWSGETRLQIKTDEGLILSGQPDLWRPGELFDWKTCRVYAFFSSKPEWEAQTNLYAWMIRQIHKVPINKIEIGAIFYDWMPSQKGQNGMPPNRFVRIPIPVWSDEAVRLYLRHQTERHRKVDPCTPEERWARPEHWILYPADKSKSPNGIKFTDEAAACLAQEKMGGKIAHRPTKCVRCNDYCPVRAVCKVRHE